MIAARDSGANKTSVCRIFEVPHSTLLGTLARVGWTGAATGDKGGPTAPRVRHPGRGKVRLVAQPVGLSRTPAGIVASTPEAGAHTEEILAELGIEGHELDRLRRDRIV